LYAYNPGWNLLFFSDHDFDGKKIPAASPALFADPENPADGQRPALVLIADLRTLLNHGDCIKPKALHSHQLCRRREPCVEQNLVRMIPGTLGSFQKFNHRIRLLGLRHLPSPCGQRSTIEPVHWSDQVLLSGGGKKTAVYRKKGVSIGPPERKDPIAFGVANGNVIEDL